MFLIIPGEWLKLMQVKISSVSEKMITTLIIKVITFGCQRHSFIL